MSSNSKQHTKNKMVHRPSNLDRRNNSLTVDNINIHESVINSDDEHSFHDKSRFDPCQAYTTNQTLCLEACQATMELPSTIGCGVSDLSRFHPSNYFTKSTKYCDENCNIDHEHVSPCLYSPSAPVGPTQCEYCGNRNTDDCKSNLPHEYTQFMRNSRDDVKDDDNSNTVNQNVCCDGNDHATEQNTQASDKDSTKSKENICPRPQLFFLKKRPPFATPEGWDPVTEYRLNLFEKPSSVEGMSRGWGEVRGHLGSNTTGEGGASNVGGLNSSVHSRNYASSACGGGSSVCGGADTEISFSSGGGGRRNSNDTTNNNKGKTNVNSSDGGRSLSPISGLISGLMESLSPS